MGAPKASGAEEASQLRDLLHKGVKNYLDPADRDVFASYGIGAEVDNSMNEGDTCSSQTLLEASLVTKELTQLEVYGGFTMLRRRIDQLTELNASLEKHLAMRTESRYGELLEASKKLIQAVSMRKVYKDYFPKLQSSFKAYTKSSLGNALSLPKLNARTTALNSLLEILENVHLLGCYRDIMRCYDLNARYRMVTAAVALHEIDLIIDRHGDAERLTVLRSLRDSFPNRFKCAIRNCAVRLDSALNFHASLQLFHLLGISEEVAAAHVLCGHRRHLFGILLSTLQRYANFDASSVPQGQRHEYAHAAGVETQPPTKCLLSDLVRCMRLLGSNVVILCICKVLSEFSCYLETLASKLEKESFGVSHSTTVLPETLKDIEPYIRVLDERGMSTYFYQVLAIVRRDFDSLRAYVCGLLVTVMDEIFLFGLKDQNDYLKIALLLRFFMLAQAECTAPLNNDIPSATGDGNDSDSTCLIEDDHIVFCVDEVDIDEVRKILHSYGNVLLSTLPKTGTCSDKDISQHFASLEEVMYSRLLVPYMELIYQETLEKLAKTFEDDPCERLAAPVGTVYERCDIFELCSLMTSRIRENMHSYGGIRICTLNPYNGWTPSSAFLGVNIDIWMPKDSSFASYANTVDNDTFTAGGTTSARIDEAHASHVDATDLQDLQNVESSIEGGQMNPLSNGSTWNEYSSFLTDAHVPTVEEATNTRRVHRQTSVLSLQDITSTAELYFTDTRDIFDGHPMRYNCAITQLGIEGCNMQPTAEENICMDSSVFQQLSDQELAYLYRNYGCVFTSASFTLWSQVLQVFKVLALQPSRAHTHVSRMMPAFDWLLLRNIRECQMSPDLGDFAYLREFVDSQAHLVTGGITGPDHKSSLSMLARLVNKIESVATLLEMLCVSLEFTCDKCSDAVTAHYNQRVPVVEELRMAVYPMCMLSLLQKRLPEDPISDLLHRDYVVLSQACTEIYEIMSGLTTHLCNIQQFIEAADCGSIPMPVKVMLWHYGCVVMGNAATDVFQLLQEMEAHPDVADAVTTAYQGPLEHCRYIYEAYRAEAAKEAALYASVIKQLAVYDRVVRGLLDMSG
ncbi:hypothetical protein X943_003834 [Babesia divergens]|uniref:Uncharacterized protein n=1 Tax=Babesia divergens TaxID=32595 RepID=A0AAD9GFZ1_BABDI|nr:hypothetical protein X943_003834 [Babesia divergens]